MRRRGRRSNSSGSAFTFLVLLAVLFFWETAVKGANAGWLPMLDDDTQAAVRDCMVRCPPPWPAAWQGEYLDTIRQAVSRDPNDEQHCRRLQILREGFSIYWPELKNMQERSHFEVRRAQIRWYVENLMTAGLPGEEEKALLRHQYEDLANHAAERLVAQFSFLDPNRVQEAKAAHLADCCRKIDAPLLPIFLTPLSAAQMEQIKERWRDLRYARVDLWRQLGGYQTTTPGNPAAPEGQEHPDYRLTQGSLDQWEGQIWALAATMPEYCRAAIASDQKAKRQRMEATSQARSRELRLSNAVLQTECLSFLLGVLLETAQEASSEPPVCQGTPTGER